MIIILPSFKRTDILKTVIESVLKANICEIKERLKIIVVNNYPANKEVINKIVDCYSRDKNFECVAHNRPETIPGVKSWFLAIEQYANEDEVIILLGDDDLMLPWGLQLRYETINKNKSDMLLTDFAHHLYFFDKGKHYWLTNELPTENEIQVSACDWNFLPEKHPEASFISNHCYRNSEAFRRGVNLAFDWANAQSWITEDMRTAMIPFYLPYAIKLSNGNVIALHSKCVIRGAVADELINSDFSNGGNRMFYDLCAFDVFNTLYKKTKNTSIVPVCTHFEKGIVMGFLTMLIDKKITVKNIYDTIKHSNFGYIKLINFNIFQGLFIILIQLLGLRGSRLRIRRFFKMYLPVNHNKYIND